MAIANSFVLVVLVLASAILLANSKIILIKDCSGNNTISSVDINPCSAEPCVFTRETTATVTVNFKSPEDSSSLKGAIYGYILGLKVGWPMPDPNGCHANITCPVTAGKVYTYSSTLTAPKDAPLIRLIVEWSLTGSNGEKQFCFQFPMQINP